MNTEWAPRAGEIVRLREGGDFRGRIKLVTHSTVHFVCAHTGAPFKESRTEFKRRYVPLAATPHFGAFSYGPINAKPRGEP